MMYLKSISMDGCGDPELSGGKDDRVFRLNRVNERECADMEP
jgi:hypothetical protein